VPLFAIHVTRPARSVDHFIIGSL